MEAEVDSKEKLKLLQTCHLQNHSDKTAER